MRTRQVWKVSRGEHYGGLLRTDQKRFVATFHSVDATCYNLGVERHVLRCGPVEANRQARLLWELYLVRRDAR
jgi:hypothetical protein